jgi:hypothetical protein
MSLDYSTTNTLLPKLRLIPLMPSVQALFTDQDLLTILNIELASKIVPLIDNQSEEYGVYINDILYDPALTEYPLPSSRAVASKLRSVSFVDPNNNEIRVPRLRPEDIMSNVNATGLAINPALWGFYLRNNTIVLYLSSVNGATSNYKYLRLRYIRQPNQLVLNNQAAQVSNIASNVVTLTNIPANYTTGQGYDFIANYPGFDSLGDDINCTNISGLDLTFASVPSMLKKGDWVCLSGQAPVAQLPYFPGYDLLLQLAAAKCLEIHGDVQGFKVAMSQAADMKTYFISVLTPRVDGNVIRLTTPNSLYGWD